MKGWIGGKIDDTQDSNSYQPDLKNIDFLPIQCNDGFKGHRGTNTSLKNIKAIIVN